MQLIQILPFLSFQRTLSDMLFSLANIAHHTVLKVMLSTLSPSLLSFFFPSFQSKHITSNLTVSSKNKTTKNKTCHLVISSVIMVTPLKFQCVGGGERRNACLKIMLGHHTRDRRGKRILPSRCTAKPNADAVPASVLL